MLDKDPLISVLLPVYNGAADVKRTLHFILHQSFSNFEVLIMDDGSTDQTWEILEEACSKDSRIRLFRQTPNKGIISALNQLAAEARSEILLREDCGDISAKNRYQMQFDALNASPQAVACVTSYWMVEENGEPLTVQWVPRTPKAISEHLKSTFLIGHSTLAFRKNIFFEIGGYDPQARHVEDLDLVIKLSQVGEILPIHEPLVARYLSASGLTFRNLKTQAAQASRIRAVYFGGAKPGVIDYPRLSLNEAKAIYHRYAGKLHLVKGRTSKARAHFSAASSLQPGNSLMVQKLFTRLPGEAIVYFRKALGRPSDPEPFFRANLPKSS